MEELTISEGGERTWEGPFVYLPLRGVESKIEVSLDAPPCAMVVTGYGHGFGLAAVVGAASTRSAAMESVLRVGTKPCLLVETKNGVSARVVIRAPRQLSDEELDAVHRAHHVMFDPQLVRPSPEQYAGMEHWTCNGLTPDMLTEHGREGFAAFGLEPGGRYRVLAVVERAFYLLEGISYYIAAESCSPARPLRSLATHET